MDIIIKAIFLLLDFVRLAVFARVILTWIKTNKESKIIIFIYQITEPILAPVRKGISKTKYGQNTMFDLAPLVVLLGLIILESILRALTGYTGGIGI